MHGVGYKKEHYGTTLTGSPTHETSYQYKFGVERNLIACMKTLTHGEKEQFSFFIQHNYRYTLFLDDLPSATLIRDKSKTSIDYFEGIPIGRFEHDASGYPKIIIYNHLEINVIIQNTNHGSHIIVVFEGDPFSITEGPTRSLNDPNQSDGE